MVKEKLCNKCNMPLVNGVCPICYQQEQEKIKKLAEKLGGLRAVKEYREDNFENKKALEYCKKKFLKEGKGLFIMGAVGVGKTHLAVALIRNTKLPLVKKPYEIMREFWGKNKIEIDSYLSKYVTHDLVIDDLGSEKSTEFTQQVLYEIIDHRYSNLKNNIIITTNLTPAECLQDQRLVSRIAEMCEVVKLSGDDYRFKKINKRGKNEII